MRKAQAITVWCDETSIRTKDNTFHIIGTLITDSDIKELEFMKSVLELRKKHRIWTTIHGSRLSYSDKELSFLEDFLQLFWAEQDVYFHVFLFKEERAWASNFEKYFAKQSAFALGLKLRKEGYPINTVFSNVGNIRFLFDRRSGDSGRRVLDNDYKTEIKKQIRKQSRRGIDLTVRFSFVSAECFDLIQMTDILLYMIKLHIEDKNGIRELSPEQQKLLGTFRKYFFNDKIVSLSDYAWAEKFNFFKSV